MAMQLLNRWRGGGVAAMLLGALLLALLSTETSLPAPATAALPADLAKVPSDSLILFSVRLADLWTGDFLKSVRGKHSKELAQAGQEFEKRFGLSLAQVERLTVAVVGPPPASREPVMIVRTVKPYELAKVLAAQVKLKPERYKGETLYVAKKWAVYPLGNQSLVYSEFASELRNWIDHQRPKEKGPLTDALEQAADKHAMVLGVNIKEYYDRGQLNQLPSGAEPFRPLSLARWITLVADFGATSRLTATFHFTNEKDAKAAVKTAESGLDLLRVSLDQGIETLSKEKDAANLVSILKQFQAPLKATRIERKGETLQASVRAEISSATAGMVIVEAVQKVREAANRAQAANNLKQIALAMCNFAGAMQGQMPAHAIYSKDGKPLLSWRVAILPYIEQQQLYKEFHLDEPWDSEHNKKLIAKMPKIYASPQDGKTAKEHVTYYQGFFGKEAFFEGKQGLPFPAGITDGTSNTIMIVEASKAVPWTKPEDIPFDLNKPLPKLGLPGSSYFLAAMCDGAVRTVAPGVSERTLRSVITVSNGDIPGSDW